MQKFRVPPIPPRKTPLKPKKTSKSNLSSLVSEYDELCQKSQTFNNGGEEELLAFMKNAKEWRQKMFTAESEAQRVSKLLFDTEKELQSKDQKIKQARQMVNLEMRERQKIEQECEELQRKWESLQSFVKTGAGVNNDTLQRIRSSVSSSILNTPIGKGKKRDEIILECSQESILDASDLFEDSADNQELDHQEQSRRRRSSRKSTTNKSIVTITTTTVDPNGHVHSTAVLESADLPEKVKTPGRNSIKRNRDFLASHDFQKKNAVGVRERCGICDKKIKFGKSCVKCLGCGLVCHPECKSEAFASSCIQEICTPDNLFTPLMASSGNTVPVAKRTRAGTQDYFQSPLLKKKY